MFVSRLFAVAALVAFSFTPEQNLNQKPAKNSIGPVNSNTDNRLNIEFSVEEASRLYADLMAQTDPTLPENHYLGKKLLESLTTLRTKMYVIENKGFPEGWNQGSRTLAFANANYCGDRRYPNKAPTPCVTFYPNLLLISMRTYVPMLKQPDRAMKNSFATYQGHEVTHFAKKPEFWTTATQEDITLEEIRAWHQTVVDYIEPLRAKNEPLWGDLTDMSDKLRVCNGRLPCTQFENFVRQNKTSK